MYSVYHVRESRCGVGESRTFVRLAPVRDRLEDKHAEAPHVALRAELAVVHGLRRRPAHLRASHEHVSVFV